MTHISYIILSGTCHTFDDRIRNEVFDKGLPLETFKRLGKGTRRPLRMMLDQVSCHPGSEHSFLTVSFVLPKGGYTTTVLSELCQITDLARSSSPSPSN